MQIKPIILALINKRPKTYIAILISIWCMTTYTILNKVIEAKIQIKIMDEKKQTFLSGQTLKLNPLLDKEKQLKQEISTIQDEIKPIKECINWVKETLGTEKRYDCTKQSWFIQKANADEVNSEIPKIGNTSNKSDTWLKNSQGQSKSRSELWGNTFEEISTAHWIPLEYWYNSEKKWKVKKEVWLCIARADSWLWKYLKTKNNIGNVGNNDRWDRVNIATLEKWVDVIFQTINNKYLWHKQSIGSLSVWWGGNSPYYATSPDNWDKNVRNCLSVIHWQEISKDFKIRL